MNKKGFLGNLEVLSERLHAAAHEQHERNMAVNMYGSALIKRLEGVNADIMGVFDRCDAFCDKVKTCRDFEMLEQGQKIYQELRALMNCTLPEDDMAIAVIQKHAQERERAYCVVRDIATDIDTLVSAMDIPSYDREQLRRSVSQVIAASFEKTEKPSIERIIQILDSHIELKHRLCSLVDKVNTIMLEILQHALSSSVES